jgi:hypothetical protein
MNIKPILPALALAILCFLGGCTEKNPISADGRDATGGLAPRILYKTGASQATVTVPSFIDTLAGWVWIGVDPAGAGRMENTFSYSNHSATIQDIPVGRARVIVAVKDTNFQDLYAGEEWVDIVAGQTASPVITAVIIPPGRPAITESGSPGPSAAS